MTPEIILYNALKTLSYKSYPQFAPQNTKNPVIIYNVTSEEVITALTKRLSTYDTRFQIDLYHDKYSDLKQMKVDLYSALDAITDGKVIIYNSSDSASDDGRRTTIDMKIWYNDIV